MSGKTAGAARLRESRSHRHEDGTLSSRLEVRAHRRGASRLSSGAHIPARGRAPRDYGRPVAQRLRHRPIQPINKQTLMPRMQRRERLQRLGARHGPVVVIRPLTRHAAVRNWVIGRRRWHLHYRHYACRTCCGSSGFRRGRGRTSARSDRLGPDQTRGDGGTSE